jgi:tetratricopeptide (TPR) repeat protein
MARNSDSLRYAERAAELDPLSVIMNVNLGRALERVGRFGDALARYRKAIEIDPSVPTSYFFLGSVYAHGFGRLNQAVPWFEKAAELDPGNPSYSLVLAGIYVDLGNLVDARRRLDQAMKQGAEAQDVATVEALLDLYEGAPAKTVRTSRKVLEVNPRNPYALNLLRVTSLQAGQYASIRDLYVRAFPELASADSPAVDGSNYGPAVDFACLLQRTGDPDRAARLLDGSERVLRSNQRMGWEGYGMRDVEIHALRGDKAQALAALREAEMAGWRGFGWRYYRDFEPNLAAIRNEPEFKAVFADIERDMANQRAELAARPKEAPLDLAPAR